MSLATETLGEKSLKYTVPQAIAEVRKLPDLNEKTREQILHDWATAAEKLPTQEQYESVRKPAKGK